MFRQSVLNEKLSELEEISKEKAALASELRKVESEGCEEDEKREHLESKIDSNQRYHNSLVDYIKKANVADADRLRKNQSGDEKIVECGNQLQQLREENANHRIRNQAISAQQEVLSSVRDKISNISAKIVKNAEDFLSPDEQKRHGFNEIRRPLAMDLEACENRLKLLGDLHDKIDAASEQNRITIEKIQDDIAECDRKVQRFDMELEKLEQEYSTELKNGERHIEDLKQQRDQAELDANVMEEKRNIAAEKLQRIENEFAMLNQELSQLQIAIERKKSERSQCDLAALKEGKRVFEDHQQIRVCNYWITNAFNNL